MISTHILDTHLGLPAGGVIVTLEIQREESWELVESATTNDDGRIIYNSKNEAGVYRLNFDISKYYKKNNQEHFFLNAPVVFKITNINRKYHVPLIINPFGYSTYRGS